MIALGIYIAGWWQTMAPLEKLGGHFWRLDRTTGAAFYAGKNTASCL